MHTNTFAGGINEDTAKEINVQCVIQVSMTANIKAEVPFLMLSDRRGKLLLPTTKSNDFDLPLLLGGVFRFCSLKGVLPAFVTPTHQPLPLKTSS